MRPTSLIVALVITALVASGLLVGCSSPTATEPPDAPVLDAAIATASTSVANASTYVFGLKQEIPGAPSNDDLEKLQTTLNAAATQTGATQRATAQSALDQFNAGIAGLTQTYDATPEGSPEKDQIQELIATLEVGRDALDLALK